uniref:KASH domain-containing protein n=1 Tax=Glossina palpalis gambiensis TaxID=67801 RepID=A0A1B0B9B5_9MUSC
MKTISFRAHLLAAWEELLGWSENAVTPCKIQKELSDLKNALNCMCNKSSSELLDTEPDLHIAIENLEKEEGQLQMYRGKMLKLNASAHSWLTKQEKRLSNALEEQQLKEAAAKVNNNELIEEKEEIESEQQLTISKQLEVLKSSSTALSQLESGLSEFKKALVQDRSTLQGLEGALKKGQPTPDDLENVKLVAKLLSEKVNVSQEQLSAVQGYLDSNQILHFTRFTASNGSLSDSGISDGGTTSDGGLSEHERHLGFLRRLAKQVESLAPGSEAMKSIAARVEAAEAELKNFQNTCRALIVRTVVSQQNKQQQHESNNGIKLNGMKLTEKVRQSSQHIDQEKRRSNDLHGSDNGRRSRRRLRCLPGNNSHIRQNNGLQTTPDDDDPSDDPSLTYEIDSSDDDQAPKRGWAWRIARVAVPMQLALFTVFCAACLMQPNCCDNINNFSMSFTPQLRYIRGPPPI